MNKLNPPTDDAKATMHCIVKERQKRIKAILSPKVAEVDAQFDDYLDAVSNPQRDLKEITSKWTYNKKDTTTVGYRLYHLYDNDKNHIPQLRQDIINNNGGEIILQCPLCGAGNPIELDHYAPRSKFPEFSVMAQNLIPICHDCNENKDNDYLSATGERLFFNAYYDVLTSDVLYDVVITYSNSTPFANVAMRTIPSPSKETMIAMSTIEKLELKKVYNREINSKLRDLASLLSSEIQHTHQTKEEFWQQKVDTYQDQINSIADVNDLSRRLYEAILANDNFKNWLFING